MTHKIGLQQWCIEEQGGVVGGRRHTSLSFVGSVVFDRSTYPPYRPRKALDAKSFPITDARTFVFCNAPRHEAATLQRHAGTLIRLEASASRMSDTLRGRKLFATLGTCPMGS